MKSGSRPILAATVAVAITVLPGCSRPSEGDCRKAIDNIRQLAGTQSDDFGSPEAAIRSCRGSASKASVKCAIAAKTKADLEKCEGGVFDEMFKDAVESKQPSAPSTPAPTEPAERALADTLPATREAITRATCDTEKSALDVSSHSPRGATHSPFSSNLPITRGRTSSRQL